MIPLYHDFTDETVLIFGGGPVGARKARGFAAEARVVVVSPDFADADFGGAELVRARPDPDDVPAWFDRAAPALAVAATDSDAVNDAVEAASRERGVLLNRADRSASVGGSAEADDDSDAPPTEGGHRDVVVPATVADGDVRVAISTGGRSPALAKYLRERIEAEIEGAEAMAELTAELRQELRASDLDPATRRDAIRAVVRDPEVWKALRTGASNPRREATRVIRNTGGDRWKPE
ncbi:MAG: bifunctional precorrin-2 dehydrogenase/sirohydrochlorin ferrochelatase [Halobellus sp.]